MATSPRPTMAAAVITTTDFDWSDPMSQFLYEKYKDAGVQFGIIFFPMTFWCLMLISYCGNALVVYATYRNRSLRNAGNYFLCGTCIGDMTHQSAHWAYFSVMVSGTDFIPQRTCFFANMVFQLGVTYSLSCTFFVGVDRLMIVGFPTFYRRLNIKWYVIGSYLIVSPLALYVFYLALVAALGRGGNQPVMCVILDSFGGDAKSTWFTASVVFSAADVIVYSMVWYLLQKRAAKNEAIRKAFPSLVAIMVSVVLGWMVNGIMTLVFLPTQPVSSWYYWSNALGLLPNTAGSTNALVLYVFSQEYRNTFRSILCGANRNKVMTKTTMAGKSFAGTV